MIESTDTITYLFGAGASVGALPLVSEIPKSLDDFIIEFSNDNFKLSHDEYFEGLNIKVTKGQLQLELIETFRWMKVGADSHASIDIFAKKLLTTRKHKEFIRLKAGLTCFFIYLQIKNQIDKRYDSFLAALINPNHQLNNLPNNLKILTWNYDFQFEKAYSAYTESNSLHENQVRLNVRPTDISSLNENDMFAIYKLNGTTGVYNVQWQSIENIVDNLENKVDLLFIESLVKSYAGFTYHSGQFRPLITFAWENENISKQVIEEAIRATHDSKVLVIIGYSFPFFNREIDREIIRSMTKLEKVYFQAPGKEAHNYIDRFRAIRKDIQDLNTEPIEDIAQFFLPPEL